MVLHAVEALGDAVTWGQGADQAVLLKRGPLVGRGQVHPQQPQLGTSRGELVEVHLLPLPVAVVAPEADRLLDAALSLGGRGEVGKRPQRRRGPPRRPCRPRACGGRRQLDSVQSPLASYSSSAPSSEETPGLDLAGDLAYRPNTTSIPERINSSFDGGSFPTCSASRDLSSVTIWETLATHSFGSPVSRDASRTFPGASAHFRLLVSGTQTTVAIRLRFKRIALYDHNRSPKAGTGAGWLGEIGPPDIPVRDHHGLRSRIRRAATAANSSHSSPTSLQTRSIASVTRSGA